MSKKIKASMKILTLLLALVIGIMPFGAKVFAAELGHNVTINYKDGETGVDGAVFTVTQVEGEYDPVAGNFKAPTMEPASFEFTINSEVAKGSYPAGVTANYDAAGKVTLGLPKGTYTIEEKTPAPGYDSQPDSYEGERPLDEQPEENKQVAKVVIPKTNADGTQYEDGDMLFKASRTLVDVKIVKLDGESADGKTPLGGATFELLTYDKATSEYVSAEPPRTAVSAEGTGLAEFKNLEAGEYQIKEIAAPEGYELNTKLHTFEVVSNDKTEMKKFSFEHTNWKTPVIEKELNDSSANAPQDVNRGKTLKYNLNVALPADIGEYNSFVITDQADEGIIFLEDVATVVNAKEQDKTSIMFTKTGSDQAIDVSSLFTVVRDADNKLTITGKHEAENWKTLLAQGDLDIEVYAKWAPATGEGTTAPRVDVVDNDDAYTNEFTLEFKNGYTAEGKPADKTTSNKVNANPWELIFNLLKTESDGITALTGAEFTLTPTAGTAFMDDYKEANTHKLVVDEQGKISVSDLDGGTYELKETKAPQGFRLLDKPITITIPEEEAGLKDTTQSVTAVELTIDTTVKNYSNDEWYPNTGTLLTLGFVAAGGVLVTTAVIKRKKNDEE